MKGKLIAVVIIIILAMLYFRGKSSTPPGSTVLIVDIPEESLVSKDGKCKLVYANRRYSVICNGVVLYNLTAEFQPKVPKPLKLTSKYLEVTGGGLYINYAGAKTAELSSDGKLLFYNDIGKLHAIYDSSGLTLVMVPIDYTPNEARMISEDGKSKLTPDLKFDINGNVFDLKDRVKGAAKIRFSKTAVEVLDNQFKVLESMPYTTGTEYVSLYPQAAFAFYNSKGDMIGGVK